MKKSYRFAAALIAVLLITTGFAHAQGETFEEDVVLMVLDAPDGVYLDQQIPHYYTTTKNGNYAVAAGANMRIVNTVDFAGVISNSYDRGFVVPFIPMNYSEMARSQYYLNAGTSQIFVKGAGVLNNGRKLEAFISLNFMGDGYTPALHQAYVKLYNFTVGKSWNLFSDINTASPLVDYWGASGFSGMRDVNIKYENWITNCINYGLSMEMPEVDATYGTLSKSITQTMPDVSGYIQYNWGYDGESTIRGSVLYRRMAYYNTEKGESTSDCGYGAQISGKAKIIPALTLYYRATAGYGIASYINDLSLYADDMVPLSEETGELTTLGMYGVLGGIKYDISSRMFVSATYSQARIYDKSDVTIEGDAYRYSQYIAANCFWNVSSYLQLAVEVLHGVKSTFNTEKSNASRANVLLQYSF